MLVTCTFYSLRHRAATVEFEVERERLAIGAIFAFAGEDYVILDRAYLVRLDKLRGSNVASGRYAMRLTWRGREVLPRMDPGGGRV